MPDAPIFRILRRSIMVFLPDGCFMLAAFWRAL
jgi:hypothetical protein